MTTCCCGNELAAGLSRIRVSPCRCAVPGRGPRQIRTGIPLHCGERQWLERRAAGLPLETDRERSIRQRWV